jgi:hypothetical protein
MSRHPVLKVIGPSVVYGFQLPDFRFRGYCAEAFRAKLEECKHSDCIDYPGSADAAVDGAHAQSRVGPVGT